MHSQEQEEVVESLKTEVEDWKGHRVEAFGPLMLNGNFKVIKSGEMGKESERDVGLIPGDVNRHHPSLSKVDQTLTTLRSTGCIFSRRSCFVARR